MGFMGRIDADMQDLVRTFTHGDGHDLIHAQETGNGDAWAQNCGAVHEDLAQQGWLTPTEVRVTRDLLEDVLELYGVREDAEEGTPVSQIHPKLADALQRIDSLLGTKALTA